MARFFSFTLFALILIAQYQSCNGFIGLILNIVKLGEFIYNTATSNTEVAPNIGKPIPDKKLMDQMAMIVTLSSKIYEVTSEIKEEIEKVPKLVLVEETMDDISESISAIDDIYNRYLQYQNISLDKNNKILTIENFANYAIDPYQCGILHYLKIIHSKFIVNSFATNIESTIMHLMLTYMQNFKVVCNKNKSPNMMLYDLYNAVTATEIKGYVVTRYAYHVLETYNGGSNYTGDLEFLQNDFLARHDKMREAFKVAFRRASTSIWRCEPETENSILRVQSSQRIILPNFFRFSNHSNFCEYQEIEYDESLLSVILDRQMPRLNCKKFTDCTLLPSDICVTENSKSLGRPEECKQLDSNPEFEDQFPDKRADNCLCTCHKSNTDLYIHLDPIFSDTKLSKVITGVRFNQKHYESGETLLYLEIQQGELKPNGIIEPNTLSWKNRLSDEFPENVYKIESYTTFFNLFAQESVDTFAYSKYGEIVVGLKFEVNEEKSDIILKPVYTDLYVLNFGEPGMLWHINLDESKFLELDYYTLPTNQTEIRQGKYNHQFYPTLDETDAGIVQDLYLDDKDSPKHSNEKSIKVSNYNQRICFQLTSDEKDYGQNLIPFIDLQPVVTNPPAPLTGAALYYKASPGYGGYMGIELRSLNYEKYI